MPIGTPGDTTFTFGSTNMQTLIFAFQDVSFPITSDSSHAVATSTSDSGTEIDFVGTNLGTDAGVVTSFSISFNGELNVTYDHVDMSYPRLFQAINNSISTGGQSVVDVFRGIDWQYDLRKVAADDMGVQGSGGDDIFKLGKGNDTYLLDGGKDNIKLGGGDDTILAGNSFGYSAKGLSVIDGQGGTDTLFLSKGLNDFFAKSYDVDLEGKSTLGKGTFEFKNVENVTGSSHGEKLSGDDGANALTGLEGNDVLYGRGGKDLLSGGVGDDTYIYAAASDSKPGADRDVISDFDIGNDTIDFSALHPHTKNDKLVYIGDEKFHKAVGEVRFQTIGGDSDSDAKTVVQIDLNGDRHADMEIELTGIIHLTKHDFIL